MVKEPLPTPAEWEAIKNETADVHAGGGNATITAPLLQELIDAARATVPNEACGLLVSDRYHADEGAPIRYLPLTNAAASPYRYMIDPQEQLRVWIEIEDAGEVVWAIVHSHLASPAIPSATDVGLAYFPDSLYIICSLTQLDQPSVRAWSIRDGQVAEVQLGVV
ncbi:MAG TPA: M67 family metallopeptidase [Candidatus Limnocylindrales bacterium]|nr:M67 family metallopeptidase [Candidatus Limnocylindrales bacterium]